MKMLWYVIVGIVCLPLCLFGRYDTQEIQLKPGWNAVFLRVQPEPAECEAVFDGIGIESVWQWNKRFTTVQYIQDPDSLIPEQPEWSTWFPGNHPQAFLSDLFEVKGGKSYLIHVNESAAPLTLAVTGRPVLPRIDWEPDSFNLVGFWVDPEQLPTFASYLEPSAAHLGQAVYYLDGNGKWKEVSSPSTEKIQAGKAYWVRCTGHSDYTGPLSLSLDSGELIDFGDSRPEIRLSIRNLAESKAIVKVRRRDSIPAPASPELPGVAGEVPVSYYEFTNPQKVGWKKMPVEFQHAVSAGTEWELRLAVRRSDMDEYSVPEGHERARYGSLLELRDGQGTLIVVPVASDSIPRHTALAAGAVPAGMRPGLWIGAATVDKVNQPAYPSYRTTPVPTKSAFQLRLIVHIDTNGQARLLQQAMIIWKEPETTNETGRYVILTDDKLAATYTDTAYRNGEFDGRRVSSAAFGFANPIGMDYTESRKTLDCIVYLKYTDPLNPFVHRFHPDHDNLDERFEKVLPEGKESFTITREIELTFSDDAPAGLNPALWEDTMWGGTYRETVKGVHKDTLYAQGKFILTHVSPIGMLNDGK